MYESVRLPSWYVGCRSDSELGQLLRACFRYAKPGTPPQRLTGAALLLWPEVRRGVDETGKGVRDNG